MRFFFQKVVHYFFDFVFVDSFPTACFKTSVCHFCLCLPKYRLSVEKKNKIEKKKTSLKFELSRVDFLFMKAMLSSSGAQIKQPI